MSKKTVFGIRGRKPLSKPYRYSASGLDNVYLLNGVTFRDTSYGKAVSIENIDDLHRAIALRIVESSEPITGNEFRFLRKVMGLTQRVLAASMHTTDQTIANYEKGNTAELGPADPLIRMQFLLRVIPEETRARVLKQIAGRLGEAEVRLPRPARQQITHKWHDRQLELA